MHDIVEYMGVRYGSVRVTVDSDLRAMMPNKPFPCLIWDHQGVKNAHKRSELAGLLIDLGCRYAVCGGALCQEWETSFDWEFVSRHLDDDDADRDAAFVMTTCHPNEDPKAVAFFFVNCTNFNEHCFDNLVVLHIGAEAEDVDIDAAVRREVIAIGG